MKHALLATAMVGLAAAALPPAWSIEPDLVYQRIHAQVADHDNRISLRLWPDDTIEMRFPAYTRQAGHYRWQAGPDERQQLENVFSELCQLPRDQLAAAIHSPREGTLTEVADADLVRFVGRGLNCEAFELVVEAPDALSRARPDVAELANLKRLESDLLDWMREYVRKVGR